MTKPRLWPNAEYDLILRNLHYDLFCEIYFYSDILTSYGWRKCSPDPEHMISHLQCFFHSLFAKYKRSLSECMVSHICWVYIYFYLFYISMLCVSMPIIVLSRDVLSCVTCTCVWWYTWCILCLWLDGNKLSVWHPMCWRLLIWLNL